MEHITVDDLLKQAKKHNIDLGKGDPYNRLRYYTKIGWLPHMTRMQNAKGNTVGHYPKYTLKRLIKIQELKSKGLTNEQISENINKSAKINALRDIIKDPKTKNNFFVVITLSLLTLILLSELDVIKIGHSKTQGLITTQDTLDVEITQAGTAFIPEEKSQIFVKAESVKNTSLIYVTFKDNYAPATRYWVENQTNGEGFIVKLDNFTLNTAEFDWWVSN